MSTFIVDLFEEERVNCGVTQMADTTASACDCQCDCYGGGCAWNNG